MRDGADRVDVANNGLKPCGCRSVWTLVLPFGDAFARQPANAECQPCAVRIHDVDRVIGILEGIVDRVNLKLAALTTRLGAASYAITRSPDAADLSMAAMTWWRRTAAAKSGTV
jgi:hypothetical protein